MALAQRLELRQSQQLVMTPQLQQAIKLLQLSNLELTQFVEQELERNPLLEREETFEAPPERLAMEAPVEPPAPGVDAGEPEPMSFAEAAADPAATLDTDYANVDPDASPSEAGAQSGDSWASLRQRLGGSEGEEANLEEFVSESLSLKDHLERQLSLAVTSPADRMIGLFLVDMVDDAGYLREELGPLADKLGCPPAMIERVLARLQTFDPPGVFARSLKECLKLQLEEQNRYDPQIAALIENLELLATHNMPALKRACQCDAAEIADMVAELRRLNPKPGLKLGSAPVQPVIPDVIVRQRADGGWHVELNSETLPRVLVNQSYYVTVSRCARKTAERVFMQDCLQTANWLVKSLDQRARTILKVSEEIVRQQDGFFAHGVQHLRPLNLKTVAEAISMHESTVSRVTSNKYMATNRGIFELKYFFTSAIASASEGAASHSSEAVRFRIKQLIDAERAEDILSDDRLVEMLKSDGIDIARRTVAKYREAMRIPSSVQRRREKRVVGV
jgi:RNA polymerase sigma-54 factor